MLNDLVSDPVGAALKMDPGCTAQFVEQFAYLMPSTIQITFTRSHSAPHYLQRPNLVESPPEFVPPSSPQHFSKTFCTRLRPCPCKYVGTGDGTWDVPYTRQGLKPLLPPISQEKRW